MGIDKASLFMRLFGVAVLLGLLLVVVFVIAISCAEPEVIEHPVPVETADNNFEERYTSTLQVYENTIAQYNEAIAKTNEHMNEYISARQWYETECQTIKERSDKLNANYNDVVIKLAQAQQEIDRYIAADYAMQQEQNLWQSEYNELRARLEEIKARQNYTVSSNLTVEKRAHFYEMLDIVWPELWE